jgi:hypothetical protein
MAVYHRECGGIVAKDNESHWRCEKCDVKVGEDQIVSDPPPSQPQLFERGEDGPYGERKA